ncbi:MAG: hypothetical protein JWM47_686 [Acidimicrobiales bacterium]|nr:hypothetical protein [Acidimicrobiales bacterium]
MATRICPQCASQYVATVRRCIDCDIVLVDEVAPGRAGDGEAVSVGAPVGDGDQIGYELEGWGNQLKESLRGMLDLSGIPQAWEAGALVVSARHEATVDDLIATLEGSEIAHLDDDIAKVALEIEGLDADGHDDLDAKLIAQAIPHAWDDEGVLLVAEVDEDRVLTLIEEALERDDDEGDDGLAAQQALTALYVAVDKLAKGPDDRKPATAFVRAAASLDGLAVPYGFSSEDWYSLKEDADALAALVARFADPGAAVDPAGAGSPDEADVVAEGGDVVDGTDGTAADTVADTAAHTVADTAAHTVADPTGGASGDHAGDPVGGAVEDGTGHEGAEDAGDRVARATEAARSLRSRLVDLV